jgi:hypothetical protein
MSKGQEELVGFGLIIGVVLIIMLVFLGLVWNSPNETNDVESYEVINFNQALLTYTTECADEYIPNYQSVVELIYSCSREDKCSDGKRSCEVLNETITKITNEAWNINEGSLYKGYSVNITEEEKEIIYINEGNVTRTFKASTQEYSNRGRNIVVEFKIYY